MTTELPDERLDDETLDEIIEFRRATFNHHTEQRHFAQSVLHHTVLVALLELRECRKAAAEPVVRPVMFIDGDISAADAEKLATIIREWDNEPVADVVAWSHPQHPKQTCNIRWRRFDVAPGPLFTAPPATANEARQNRDLVMMVKVLARTVRKYNAGSQQAKDFLAYLERECLVSSTDCLRIDAKDPG